MLRRFIILCLLLAAPPIVAVGAQSDSAALDQLNIALWPEYDRPAVLVIYRAELAPEIALPARVTLPIPSEAGQPHAVATAAEDGQLINAEFSTETEGAWALVTVEAERRTVWLEYYDELTIEGENRQFVLQWPATVAVEELNYEVQEPIGARDVEVQPAPSGRRLGDEGLSYAQGTLGAVAQGQQASIELAYSRSQDELTANLLGGPAVAGELPAAESEPASRWLPFAFGGLAAAALAAGSYLLWLRPRRSKSAARGRRRRPAGGDKRAARYCHQCGQAAKAGDRFCRRCGTELRR